MYNILISNCHLNLLKEILLSEIDWATFALLTLLYYSKYLAITQTKPRKENKRSKLYSETPQ